MAPITRSGLGGPFAAYPGFSAKSSSTSTSFASYLISQGIGSPSGVPWWLTFGLGTFGAAVVAPDVTVTVFYPTVALQFAYNPLDESVWTDNTDIRGQEPLVLEYGISGNSPSDRIASAGKLTFALDNSEHNSVGQVGLYSLLRGDKLGGFDLNMPVRIGISCDEVDNGLVYWKFRGRLQDARPDPGDKLQRMTHCTALDLMDDWATADEPDLDVQLDKSSDALITSILDALDPAMQPVSRDIEAGLESYPYALDGSSGQRLTVRERLNQICLSEFGKAFMRGDTTGGGTFAFVNRHHAPRDPTVLFELDNDMTLDGLVLQSSRDQVYRSVQVTVHPTNTVSLEPIAVIYSLQSTDFFLAPGETNSTLFGPYRDQDTNQQIGGTDIITPVASTDYAFNAAQDGSGTDVTASITATASATGSGVRWTLTNNGSVGAYKQVLQLRGRAIRRSTLLIEKVVPGGYGRQVLTLDMPYQGSANVGSDIAVYLANLLNTPSARITSVRFLANQSQAHMKAALKREVGERIAVSETVTGLDHVECIINSVRLEIEQGGIMWCTWNLDAVSATHYWLLGVPGFSELGVTTVLGI